MAVTAATSGFAFVQPYRGGDVVARRNTLIAIDGEHGDPHAARRLPAGDAQPAAEPRPHGGAAGAVRAMSALLQRTGELTIETPGRGMQDVTARLAHWLVETQACARGC